MPSWAISRLTTFNLTVLVIGILFAICLYRKRTPGVAIRGIILISITSGVLVLLTQQTKFFQIALACSILFLHLPLWLTISTALLWRQYRLLSLVTAVTAILLLVVAIDAFFIEPTALEVTHYEIVDPRIKQPMRIVVIADLQTDIIGDHERNTLETVLRQKPDLILFAGDYFSVSSYKDWQKICADFQNLTRDLEFDAPLGIYAIRGNLDTFLPWPVAFRNMSGRWVNGSTKSFVIGDIRLTCLSEPDSFDAKLKLTDTHLRGKPLRTTKNRRKPTPFETAKENHDADRFHIVLGHSPDFALGSVDADLLLAGHTHGGQICFPLIGAISTGCQVPRAWASGMTELPDIGGDKPRRLIVSRGTGMERGVAPRIRFLCRPELVVIDLKPEKSSQTAHSPSKDID